MTELFDKLSEYNIINNIIPGSIFLHLLGKVTEPATFHNMVVELCIYYFVGFILSRVGSLLIEPILKKIKFIHWIDYSLIVKSKDDKIQSLITTSNLMRTLLSATIFLLILNFRPDLMSYKYFNEFILIGVLTIILLSYRKQTKYIIDRIQNA